MLDYFEFHMSMFIFVVLGFTSVVLITAIIFFEFPPIVESIMVTSTIIMIVGGLVYFCWDNIKALWDFPELELWEWILLLGIMGTLILAFVGMSYNIASFNVLELVPMPSR